MKIRLTALLILTTLTAAAQSISQQQMQRIYNEVRTPYKYGMVVAPTDNYHKIDCPTVFRVGEKWFMTYVVYNGKGGLDGRGYETWMAESDDLLHWKTQTNGADSLPSSTGHGEEDTALPNTRKITG